MTKLSPTGATLQESALETGPVYHFAPSPQMNKDVWLWVKQRTEPEPAEETAHRSCGSSNYRSLMAASALTDPSSKCDLYAVVHSVLKVPILF